MSEAEDSVVNFRKVGHFKRSGIRKRIVEEKKEDSSNSDNNFDEKSEEISLSLQRGRKLRRKDMIHTTNKKRREQLDKLSDASSSDLDHDQPTSSFDPDIKFNSSYSTELEGPRDMGATARSEVDTDYSKDAQAQFERIQRELEKQDDMNSNETTEKTYKGISMYGAKKKSDTVKGSAASGLNRIGPIRATQYMRSSVRWDYAPDICKDFKETGYCTFGDSCKFMHDRTDYKHGWQLEKEWEEGKFAESKDDEFLISSDEDDSNSKNLPSHCFICRNPFKNPIVTKCKHYFCEVCALERCKKTRKCAVCDAKTEGQFVVAKDILAKLKAEKESNLKEEEENDNVDELCSTNLESITVENSDD